MWTQRLLCRVGSRWGLLLLYICLCTAAAAADGGSPTEEAAGEESYTADTFPNPMRDFQACGVNQFSYVCDPTQSLTEHEIQKLNIAIESLSSVETCLCDDSSECREETSQHTIMIALVQRIRYSTGGFPHTEEAELTAARRFADHLRDTGWGVGEVSCSLRAYIVHDIHTRQTWTATNHNGNKVITKDRALEVTKAATDEYFKYHLTFAGVEDMVSKYKQLLEVDPPGLNWLQILLVVLGGLWAVAVFLMLLWRF